MNKFKVSISHYVEALSNYNIELNKNLQNRIIYFENKFKKPGLFKNPTALEIAEYSKKLNDINYGWNIMDDEYSIYVLNWKIKENTNIINSLDFVNEYHFIADDDTLAFINKYCTL